MNQVSFILFYFFFEGLYFTKKKIKNLVLLYYNSHSNYSTVNARYLKRTFYFTVNQIQIRLCPIVKEGNEALRNIKICYNPFHSLHEESKITNTIAISG